MRYRFMIAFVGLALMVGMNARAAGPDAKELAAKGHSLFLEVLGGDRSKLPEAIGAMEQSREADPQNVANLYNLGRAYFFGAIALKNFAGVNKAESTFAKIVELDPKHSTALAFHGSSLTIQSGGQDLAKFFR